MKKMIDNIRKYLPAVLLLVLLLFCIRYREDLSVEKILRYTPKEPVKAALLMLVFYAVKSVSFVFPIAVLQLAVGHLFSTGTALLVNFLGRAVTLALPYWMGRFSGSSMVVHWKRNPTTCRLYLGGTFLSVKRLNYRQR